MPRLRTWADDTVFGPESGQRLLLVHTGIAVLIGLRIAVGPYRQLAGTPDELLDPVPVLAWIPAMPTAAILGAIQVVGTAAAVAAALRWRTRCTFALAWVAYVVLAGLRGSRGKILHNDLLLIWVAVPFLLAPLGVAWADRRPSRALGWPIRVATVLTVLAYFFAGYHKLRRSGPGWAFGENMHHVVLWGPSSGQAGWAAFATWMVEQPGAARAAAIGILGFELSIPLVLVNRRLLPWYAAVAVVLHAGTFLLLGLDYWAWMVAVPLLFVDWPAAVALRGSTAPPLPSGRVRLP